MAFVVGDHGTFRLVEKVRLGNGRRRNVTLACLGRFPTVEAAVSGLADEISASVATIDRINRMLREFGHSPKLRGELWSTERKLERLTEQLEDIRAYLAGRSREQVGAE